jgi:hypothetical protein
MGLFTPVTMCISSDNSQIFLKNFRYKEPTLGPSSEHFFHIYIRRNRKSALWRQPYMPPPHQTLAKITIFYTRVSYINGCARTAKSGCLTKRQCNEYNPIRCSRNNPKMYLGWKLLLYRAMRNH